MSFTRGKEPQCLLHLGYTGATFTRGKEVLPSHNPLLQEHLNRRIIQPFTKMIITMTTVGVCG